MNALASIKATIKPATQEIIEASYGEGIKTDVEKGWATIVPTLVRYSPILGTAEIKETRIFFSPDFMECVWAYNFWYKTVIKGKMYLMNYEDGALTLDCR